jgi:hypothetical protein
MPMWEYLTWTTTDTKAGRSIRDINGEQLTTYQLEHPALVEVGAQGWELVSVVVVSGSKNGHTLYFKRPLRDSEDSVQGSSTERQSDDEAIADAWAGQTGLRQPGEDEA